MIRPRRASPPRRFRLHALALAATAALGAAHPTLGQPVPTPAPAAKPWYEEIAVNGFVTASYSYNTNRPPSGTNRFRVFDFDDNTFKVDVAELVIQKAVAKPGETGFRLDAVAGGSIPRVSAAAGLFRDSSGKAQDFDLQQAFVSTIVPFGSGLRVDVGKFVTHHGYEVIEGYDSTNDNATHSFLFGYAIPFTHTGIRAGYTFSDRISAMVMLANGWDNVKDNNTGKSFGAQVTWTPAKPVTVVANYMVGPERDGNDHDLRHMVDVNAQWKISDQTALTVDVVYGSEPNAVTQGETAMWNGIVGYARFGLTDTFALILRGELFNDRDGARTGVAQKLKAVTLTPEFKVSSHFVVRADLRVDWSNQDSFEKKEGFTSSQPTGLLNVIYLF
jgi:hypothetical protein